MISVYFMGRSSDLSHQLEKCYQTINGDPEYDIYVSFEIIPKSRSGFGHLKIKRGLLFFELTEPDSNSEKILIDGILKTYPSLQWVLMVSPNIDYFDIASRFHIGNIIKKNLFDTSIIRAITIRLMTGNVFGFAPYFPNGFTNGPLVKTIFGKTAVHSVLKDFENRFLSAIQGNGIGK